MNWLLTTALVALLTLLSSPSKAQQNKLYLWVDTVFVDAGQSDVFLDIKYRLEVGRPPVEFNGYRAEIIFGEQSEVNVVSIHLEHTASRNFSDPLTTIEPARVLVVALGALVDTNLSTLFRLRVNVKSGLSAGNQAEFIWASMQLSDISGIDEVILGRGMIERRKKVDPVPTIDSVMIEIPGITVLDTTSFALPVHFSEISPSNVKHMVLSFDYDSSVIRFDSASLMPGVTDVTVEEVIQPTHADVFLQSVDTNRIKGGGHLFALHFTSVLRADTVCTMIQPISFQVLSDGFKIDTSHITIGDICVNGTFVPEDTTSGGIEMRQDKLIRISSNPLKESTTFSVEGFQGRLTVQIFDLSGSEVFRGSQFNTIEWRPIGLAKGLYYARIEYDRTIEILKLMLE